MTVTAASAVAPDGSPVEAFALLPPGPAPALVASVAPPGASVLELGCGAARLLRPLAAQGYVCTGVDQSPEMLARVPAGIEAVQGDIETVDLGARFDAVVLASFLVNTIDSARRTRFLLAARRHVADGGRVVVQRLDPELVPVAVDATSEEDGVLYEMRDVRHDGGLFTATMRFTIGGAGPFEHRYTGVVLDDAAFEAAARDAGLGVERYLDGQRTWAVLR